MKERREGRHRPAPPPRGWAPHINSDQPLLKIKRAWRLAGRADLPAIDSPPSRPVHSLAVAVAAVGAPRRMTQSMRSGGSGRGHGKGQYSGGNHHHHLHHSALCCLSAAPPLPGDATPTLMPEPEAAAAAAGSAVAVEGVLHKWTNYGRGWRERWFSLRDGVLSYSKIRADAGVARAGARAEAADGDGEVRLIGSRMGGARRNEKPAGVVFLKVRPLVPVPSFSSSSSRAVGAWSRPAGPPGGTDSASWFRPLVCLSTVSPRIPPDCSLGECNPRLILTFSPRLLPAHWICEIFFFSYWNLWIWLPSRCSQRRCWLEGIIASLDQVSENCQTEKKKRNSI